MPTFNEYLLTRRIADTPSGDFAADAVADPNFPVVTTWEDIVAYVSPRADGRIRRDVLRAARTVWAGYQRAQKGPQNERGLRGVEIP